MPTFTKDITPTTDRLATIDGDIVSPGNLFTVVAFLLTGTSTTGRTAIQICTFANTPAEQNILSVLVDDYIYNGHNPSWNGFVPLEKDEGIMAIVRSADTITVRVIGKVLKHDC